jgi:hypothetical protein
VCHVCKPAIYFANDFDEIFPMFVDTAFLLAQMQKFLHSDCDIGREKLVIPLLFRKVKNLVTALW